MADAKSRDDVTMEALRADLDRLREDVATLTHHLGSAGESAYDDVRRRARDASRQAGEAARERWNEGRSSLETEIAERPLTVIGIAFAAGLLLGRGLSR
jgi:ElaB/YqjD/DUF883 family membrane-anchored ribosome-binding protein